MSDSDSSVDSDSGIRFKTQSVRNLSQDNLIIDKQKKYDDYEYKYDKRYIRDDDYKYRKRHKHSEENIRSKNIRFENERTSTKRENIKKSYDNDYVNHKSKEYHESKRKKDILKLEDDDSIDAYGPTLPPHTVINKYQETQETTKEFVKLKDEQPNDTYGPILPTSSIHKSKDIRETKIESIKLEDNKTNDSINILSSSHNVGIYGPCFPSKPAPIVNDVNLYGPALPSSSATKPTENDEDKNSYGPCLPENINNLKPAKIYGPSLPATFTKSVSSDSENDTREEFGTNSESDRIYGPSIHSTFTNIKTSPTPDENMTEHNEPNSISIDHENVDQLDDEEDVIGPLLPGMVKNNRIQSELECRALELKMKLEFPSAEQKTREDWMIELPGIQKVSGVGPRKFRANPGPDLSDRSSWTDTPQDKSKKHSTKSLKNELKIEAENREIQRRDKEQEKIIKNHKKHSKRDKSLMDMHQQKLAKEKKEAGQTERRPFNRDIDLKLNMFDPEKKSRMLKNACLLDDKFSTGKSKYL